MAGFVAVTVFAVGGSRQWNGTPPTAKNVTATRQDWRKTREMLWTLLSMYTRQGPIQIRRISSNE
jgi:hypothetical protein